MENQTHEHVFDVANGGGYILNCNCKQNDALGDARFWWNPDVDLGEDSEDIDEGAGEWCLVFEGGDETDNYRADSLENALKDAEDYCEQDEDSDNWDYDQSDPGELLD